VSPERNGNADGPCSASTDDAVVRHFDDVLQANRSFAATYADPNLPGRAARRLALLTCMDSRIDPLAMLGLSRGDAKILRNAGARVTDDVLRTLVLAVYLLDVGRVMIVAHTDCRMAKHSETELRASVMAESGLDTRSLDFGAIDDQYAVLVRDVQRVRSWPYLPPGLPVIGCQYDLSTGLINVLVSEDDAAVR
jgi:carbonic anhydrase